MHGDYDAVVGRADPLPICPMAVEAVSAPGADGACTKAAWWQRSTSTSALLRTEPPVLLADQHGTSRMMAACPELGAREPGGRNRSSRLILASAAGLAEVQSFGKPGSTCRRTTPVAAPAVARHHVGRWRRRCGGGRDSRPPRSSGLDTLQQRLEEAQREAGAVVLLPTVVGALGPPRRDALTARRQLAPCLADGSAPTERGELRHGSGSSASGSTSTSASTGMKFVSPAQRGTTCCVDVVDDAGSGDATAGSSRGCTPWRCVSRCRGALESRVADEPVDRRAPPRRRRARAVAARGAVRGDHRGGLRRTGSG